ncbi:hypothetical protein Avbf_01608 [Armadillidium vulgare]|nr:hypothetical protein Avbf_01608 [Armadillidium vulgare]
MNFCPLAIREQNIEYEIRIYVYSKSAQPVSGGNWEWIFWGLSQLKVLILEQQLYLRKIDDYAFGHLTSLETFVLRYVPKIQRIPSKAFHINTANQTSGLKCPIRDLTLEFTTLSTIPEDLLDWDKVRYVNLRNNRWICDCHFKWIKNSNLEEITNYSIYAYGPFQHRGKNTKTLKEDEFTCEVLVITGRSGAVALLGIIVFAMLISFTTVLVLVYRRNGWLWNPPRVSYDKIDSPLNTITIFDRSVESLTETDGRQRNSVYIHDG